MALTVGLLLALLVLDSPWNWVAVLAGAVIDVGESLLLVRWSRRRRATVGAEALVGRHAVAVTDLWPAGQVKLDGELWQARCEAGASAGDTVVVRRIEGLTLEVEAA